MALDAPTPAQPWCDAETGLCWQNPQREIRENSADRPLIAAEAEHYCESLVLDGHDDWRLPGIDELRAIIDGNPATEPGGDCGIAAGMATAASTNAACHGGMQYAGPGSNGCYWKAGLTGTCDNPDPAAEGHPLETWAHDRAVDDPEQWIAYVAFETGAAGFNHSCSVADVRCVRDDDGRTPDCAATDTCTDSAPFVSDPALTATCDADVCASSDALRVTLHLPDKLDRVPYQLMAFYYSDANWTMPPARPPDGGTDYNQVMDPAIDVGQPLTMTVPACTYYREDSLTGDYRLYVYLQMEKKFPPTPKAGDYWWGSTTPVTFPLQGTAHAGRVEALEIVLEPVR